MDEIEQALVELRDWLVKYGATITYGTHYLLIVFYEKDIQVIVRTPFSFNGEMKDLTNHSTGEEITLPSQPKGGVRDEF